FALGVVGEQRQGMVNGLQVDAFVVAEDGRDDVDQLGHVGDFDDVGVVDEGVEEGGDDQRVLQVVVLLQDAAATLLGAAGAVPDIPFIPGDIDLAIAGLSGEGRVDDALGGFGAPVEFDGTGHEVAEVVRGVADVGVKREIVGVLAEVLENRAVPGGPVRAGAEVGRAGGDQLDGGVGPLHELGGFEGELAIVVGAAVAHLPGAIHLVTEAPELDLPGIAASVLAAQAGHGGVFGGIAILHPLLGFGPGAGAEVGADVGLG